MIDRLKLSDSITSWIDKVNRVMDINVVDGNFSITASQPGISPIHVIVTGGLVRQDGQLLSVDSTKINLAPASSYVIAIAATEANSYAVRSYGTDAVPTTVIPLYRVETNNQSVTSVIDVRTWIDFSTSEIVDPSQVTSQGEWNPTSNTFPEIPPNSSFWVVVGADAGYEVDGEVYYTNDVLLYVVSLDKWVKLSNQGSGGNTTGVAFVDFDVSDSGDLIVTYSSAAQQDSFKIDNNGYLQVTI